MKPVKTSLIGVLVVAACVLTIHGVLSQPREMRNRSRLNTEFKAIQTALERYRSDHGTYPTNSNTEEISPEQHFAPIDYIEASQFLYRELSGDADGNPRTVSPGDRKSYLALKEEMIRTAPGGSYIVDPWGNPYGYSTLKAKHPDSDSGHNTSFDFWSTCGHRRAKDRQFWTRNWRSDVNSQEPVPPPSNTAIPKP